MWVDPAELDTEIVEEFISISDGQVRQAVGAVGCCRGGGAVGCCRGGGAGGCCRGGGAVGCCRGMEQAPQRWLVSGGIPHCECLQFCQEHHMIDVPSPHSRVTRSSAASSLPQVFIFQLDSAWCSMTEAEHGHNTGCHMVCSTASAGHLRACDSPTVLLPEGNSSKALHKTSRPTRCCPVQSIHQGFILKLSQGTDLSTTGVVLVFPSARWE